VCECVQLDSREPPRSTSKRERSGRGGIQTLEHLSVLPVFKTTPTTPPETLRKTGLAHNQPRHLPATCQSRSGLLAATLPSRRPIAFVIVRRAVCDHQVLPVATKPQALHHQHNVAGAGVAPCLLEQPVRVPQVVRVPLPFDEHRNNRGSDCYRLMLVAAPLLLTEGLHRVPLTTDLTGIRRHNASMGWGDSATLANSITGQL
jgi:hypothetical protein